MEFVHHKEQIGDKKKSTLKPVSADFPTPSNEIHFAMRKELNKNRVQVR